MVSINLYIDFRFIFLFRWTEERRARRKVVENAAEIFVKDEEKVNSIFFAQQVGMCFKRRHLTIDDLIFKLLLFIVL